MGTTDVLPLHQHECQSETNVTLLPPADVMHTLEALDREVDATILDPWYNRGVGGVIPDYNEWLAQLLDRTMSVSKHAFLWGFPDIVCHVLDRLPRGTELVAWLTWYFKNCPTVIRGWRPGQYTCLHIARSDAPLYPEHFMNELQQEKLAAGKLRYIPGPTTVFEAPLNIGFVGKHEQTGHPSQKPISVIEPLILMSTKEGDTVLDPMCGAGTTGIACQRTRRNAIICDLSQEYMEIAARRIEAGPAANGHLCEKYSVKNSNMMLFCSSEEYRTISRRETLPGSGCSSP